MGKIAGILLVLSGVSGVLWSWMIQQKEKQMQLEEVIQFLQKSIFVMENEKVKLITHFEKYTAIDGLKKDKNETILEKTLHEIAKRLESNTYPNGQMVWEEVFMEEEQNWAVDNVTLGLLLQAGNGFFGRCREENICFLQKSIYELEKMREKIKEKDMQDRKVWVPVGLLGAVMLLIMFV